MSDRIHREITISAPIRRVWAVLTESDHIARWFGDAAELDLRPGGRALFGWAEHGTFRAEIQHVDPCRYLAYRWAAEPDVDPTPANSTLVEFQLTPVDGGTRLSVTESGFAELTMSADERRKHLQGNASRWSSELAELQAYAARAASADRPPQRGR